MGNEVYYHSAKIRNWMVIYTRPRWEKKVDLLLKQQGIESFCPVRKVERQWADRKKMVELPLFNSYIFVKVNLKEEVQVRQCLGVLNFIYYLGKPAIVKEAVVNDIRQFLKVCPDMETYNLTDISLGDRVQIKKGIFYNQLGEIIKIQGKNVVMVLEHLGCALITKVPLNNISLYHN